MKVKQSPNLLKQQSDGIHFNDTFKTTLMTYVNMNSPAIHGKGKKPQEKTPSRQSKALNSPGRARKSSRLSVRKESRLTHLVSEMQSPRKLGSKTPQKSEISSPRKLTSRMAAPNEQLI